jgi:hypothetical protein
LQHGDFATGFVGAGAGLAAVGAVLWLTAPSDATRSGRLVLSSTATGANGAGVELRGAW